VNPAAQSFHDVYWNSRVWEWTFWQGVPTLKCPLDLWVYQELLWKVRPELVVELGTWAGGSAAFIAHTMDLYGAPSCARVVTVDVLGAEPFRPHAERYADAPFPVRIRPPHERVEYVTGDSLSEEVIARVYSTAAERAPVMVIADSDHSFGHAYGELLAYHEIVTPGSWFIMEDTDGSEAHRAVDAFLAENDLFAPDPQCEKFQMTFNPGGYLRRRE
jgi:cephalosporin hydroxylase